MASKIDTEDLVICPICFEQFTNPKCLPCLHSFCHLCLKSYIIKQHDGEGKTAKEFPCPVCRQVATVTDMSLTSEKIADSLPDNCLMNCLIERSKTAEQSPNEKVCGPCDYDNEKTIAVSWCTQCLEPLCGSCAHSHKRFRHVIVPVETVAKEKQVELLDVDEPCIKHAGKVLEVYCVDHKEVCCVICLATSHRKCEHICTFEEMVTGPNTCDKESVDQFADFLTEIERKTDDLRTKADGNLTTLNDRHNKVSTQVATTVQQAKDKLDHLQSSFMTKFQQIHKQESVKLTETKEKIEIFQKTVKKGQQLLKVVREQGSPKQVFLTKEKLKMQLKHHMEGLKVDLKNTPCVEYLLNTDGMVTSILNNLTSVAEIDLKPTLDLSSILNEVSDFVDCFYKEQPVDVMSLGINQERRIKPGTEITGGTSLPDGRIVLCCFDNKQLNVYDQELNFLFDKTCDNGHPRDACSISSSDIVVSVYDQPYLEKYKIQQNTIKSIGKIPCKDGSWGLAATTDNIIVGYRGEVDIMSMDGLVLRTFSRKADDVSSVALSLTRNVYYIDGNDIVCKTLDGKEISRFTHPSLRRLMGIAVDKYGNVYVCGYVSDNVCVFSPDGQRSNVLIATIQKPEKIILDSTETKLCVTTLSEGVFYYHLKNRKTLSEPRK